MALNGFRSAEDKASRLVSVRGKLVTVVRVRTQHYEVYADGRKLGEVFKVRKGWDWTGDGLHRLWRGVCASRQTALEALLGSTRVNAAIAAATKD